MESYITYTYYTQTFGGTLVPQDNFKKYSIKASNEVRNQIMGRDTGDYDNEVKFVTCSVMELMYTQEKIKEKQISVTSGKDVIITNEKVGDYSRTVSSVNVNDLEATITNIDKQIKEEIYNGLALTGLLNRGMNVL